MKEPETLDYASSAIDPPARRGMRGVLVIVASTHLALVPAIYASGAFLSYFRSNLIDDLVGLAGAYCIACTPLLLLAEIGMLIFHPKRFPIWIPAVQGPAVVVLYILTHGGF